MSRPFVLSLILLVLLGVAFYIYPQTVQDYATPVLNPVLKMAGIGSIDSDGSDPPEDSTESEEPVPEKDTSVAENPATGSPQEPNPEETKQQSSGDVDSSNQVSPDLETDPGTIAESTDSTNSETDGIEEHDVKVTKLAEDQEDQEPEPSESPGVSEPEAEDKLPPENQAEAVEGSGETIRYSEIGRFPMSNPPEGYQRARRAYESGDFRQARSLLKGLIETYPKSANTNYMLGMIHFQQGEFDDAHTYFEKASTLDHDPQIQSWSRQYLKRIERELRG